MISYVIRTCIANRFLVFLATIFLSVWGIWAVYNTPVDALPDLSDVQVIVQTPYPGQAPQLVENMVTYPLTTTMLSVPGAKTVRGFSSFGTSFIYIIFEEGTDLYWARTRVLEYLNQAQSKLPSGVTSSIGPDATGVGWVYEYALVDRTGKHDISELRSLQDWLLKFELATVPDVAEVASVGGVVKEYQIVVDPIKLDQFGITLPQVTSAIKNSNQEAGGSVIEQAEAEYMVRASGYLESLDDFRNIVLKTSGNGTPIYLGDIAKINIGPEMRRGVAELDGQGEVAGGIVLLRSGKNAHDVINNVREKLEQLKSSLPEGVEIVSTYDRSQIIDRAIHNLSSKLIEEFIVVAIVCALFLMHVRSALVAIMSLPLGLFFAFIIMYYQGVTANIMSLGGIAIAVGAMVDAAVVMIENTHKKIEHWSKENPFQELSNKQRWELVSVASAEVAPALFISLLIITLSFIPVFSLEGQEGKLFGPLAFTKTYSMAGAAFLAVLVVPVLMGVCIRGKIPEEHKNPINRFLLSAYHPAITWVLKHPKRVLLGALMILLTCLWPLSHIGGEFLPRIDEGDLLYMPSTLPGVSSSEATRILQTTDKLIKTVPEVKQVFGKVGRAETATDSAPMAMLESTIQLKPKEEWRPGMTPDKIIEELDRIVRLPGVANLWVPPIRNRIDMISTGVKSPIGIKVSGTDMHIIDDTAEAVQEASKKVSGVVSALAEKLIGGRYVDVKINHQAAARYGLNIADVQAYITSAVGGGMLTDTVEGIARYPVNVRYPQEYRDSVYSLQSLPIRTPEGRSLVLGDVADITTTIGPMMIKSENARPAAWVFIDARGRDMLSVVHDLQKVIQKEVKLPSGVSISYTGQFELMERANAKLTLMVPATLLIIFVLLYLEFRNIKEALLIMFSLPFALVGGIWFMYIKGYDMSVATGIGFIALAGLAAEFGVIMLIYLRHALQEKPELRGLLNKSSDEEEKKETPHHVDLEKVEQAAEIAIYEGAALRVRPKAMTVATIIAGLLPIFWSDGTGSEVMTRIAAPMIGGMVSASILSMFIIPAAYKLITMHAIKGKRKE